jgi:hypothetical protein
LDGLGDLTGALRLEGGGAGRTFWDNIVLGTAWEDVLQVNVPRITLQVNTEKGTTKLINETDIDFDLHYYEIVSPDDALNRDDWNSLQKQGLDNGNWKENNPSAAQLTESNFLGSSVLPAGEEWRLGDAFLPGGAETLVARTATAGGLVNLAIVDYVVGGDELCGDFDSDTDVDTSDLNQLILGWTGALDPGAGSAEFANGDCDGDGDVDSADLNSLLVNWTGAQATAGASSGRLSAQVPEPTGTLWTLGALLLVGSYCRWRINDSWASRQRAASI